MISSLSGPELAALSRVVDLWEEIWTTLHSIDAKPQVSALHIDTEAYPGYFGWVGWDEGGGISFQPAPAEVKDD